MAKRKSSSTNTTEVDRLHIEVGKLFDRLFELSLERLESKAPSLFVSLNQINRTRPRVVIAVNSRQTLGCAWYSPNRWGKEQQFIDEIAVLPGTTSNGVYFTSDSLVHELAHFVNYALKIKDTSRGGQYHNGKFKEMAEIFGLKVQKSSDFGYAHTDLGNELRKQVESIVAKKQIDVSVFELERRHVSAGKTLTKIRCPNCNTFAYVLTKRLDEFQVRCGKCDRRLAAI